MEAPEQPTPFLLFFSWLLWGEASTVSPQAYMPTDPQVQVASTGEVYWQKVL
ncbi:hypothetical protein I79_001198 [Cricetulus griseus]|uniref:Uncharacterized protein n=1 Tax=Cricetulus griseus TaxID=10029 RepID=G3GU49_CRIGR|nr:hypothetical protein I79_001198 [Cricetulus griseus]